METPQNLVDAVNRISPRAILILDTNTIMDVLRLDLYEINVPGLFLLVVPRRVVNQLLALKLGDNERKSKRASLALDVMDNLYARGNSVTGIDLGNGHWLVTADSPKSPNSNSPEDEQIRRLLGKVDHDLKKLADACVQDCPNTRTLLVTRDKNPRIVARSDGHSVISVSNLRSSEVLERELQYASPSEAPDFKGAFENLVNSDEERPVRIMVTMEELRSEGDDLVARGAGSLAYDGKRLPFRWTFPYKNLSIYNQLTDDTPESAWYAVMPLENVDFMGADDEIPEEVRRYACSMLEAAYELNNLQSSLTKVRSSINWHTSMGFTRGGLYGGPTTKIQKQELTLTPEEAERYDQLRLQSDRQMHSLFDGSAKSVGRAYRSVFRLDEEVDKLFGYGLDEYDDDNWDLETALIEFLDDAVDTWTVGETREEEFTHLPFAWPEEEEEAFADDEEEVGEESE